MKQIVTLIILAGLTALGAALISSGTGYPFLDVFSVSGGGMVLGILCHSFNFKLDI